MFWLQLTVLLCLLRLTRSQDNPLSIDRNHYIGQYSLSAVVKNNFLYWYGGVKYFTNSTGAIRFTFLRNTYSIDVTSDWTNATVSVNALNVNTGTDLRLSNVWSVESESSFYSYNGFVYPGTTPPPNNLLEFKPTGTGGGIWSDATSFRTANSNFSSLVRVSSPASACGANTCYAVGGKQDASTKANLSDAGIPASGIVSYNFTSKTWYNDTLPSDIFAGCWLFGQLLYTDIVGEKGMLIAMGGASAPLSDPSDLLMLSYENIYLYDIGTKTWYQQKSTGEVPGLRYYPCAVSIESSSKVNRTVEIFLYGGTDLNKGNATQKDLADVWVLSLPAFQWHRAGLIPAIGHVLGSCVIAGKRQMISVGGVDPYIAYDNGTRYVTGVDPSLGIKVFDLTDMIWKDRFTANAPAYQSPQAVQKWYANNTHVPQDISDDVRSLFVGSSATASSPSPTSTASSTSSNSNGGGTNVGAIAGGVVGGVALLIAILVGIWLSRRRRRHAASQNMTQISEPTVYYEAAGREVGEMESANSPSYEADGQSVRKDFSQLREMP